MLKEEIKLLQSEEDEILAKLNETKNRYNTFTSNDKYVSIGYNKNTKNSHNKINQSFKNTTFEEN